MTMQGADAFFRNPQPPFVEEFCAAVQAQDHQTALAVFMRAERQGGLGGVGLESFLNAALEHFERKRLVGDARNCLLYLQDKLDQVSELTMHQLPKCSAVSWQG